MKRCKRCWDGEALENNDYCAPCTDLLLSIADTVIVHDLYDCTDTDGQWHPVDAEGGDDALARFAVRYPGKTLASIRRISRSITGKRVPKLK